MARPTARFCERQVFLFAAHEGGKRTPACFPFYCFHHDGLWSYQTHIPRVAIFVPFFRAVRLSPLRSPPAVQSFLLFFSLFSLRRLKIAFPYPQESYKTRKAFPIRNFLYKLRIGSCQNQIRRSAAHDFPALTNYSAESKISPRKIRGTILLSNLQNAGWHLFT